MKLWKQRERKLTKEIKVEVATMLNPTIVKTCLNNKKNHVGKNERYNSVLYLKNKMIFFVNFELN